MEKIDADTWETTLRQALADDALIDLNMRSLFEANVANTLAHQWKFGHESLFRAAINVFHWNESHRRLEQFQRAGAFLVNAIHEQRLLLGLPNDERVMLQAAITRMGDPRHPDLEDIDTHFFALSRLEQSFPALMAITIGHASCYRWLSARNDDSAYTLTEEEEARSIEIDKKKNDWRDGFSQAS